MDHAFGNRNRAISSRTSRRTNEGAKALGVTIDRSRHSPAASQVSTSRLERDVSADAVRDLKADEIAARQLHALRAYQRPREKKLRLTDVNEMFLQMRDNLA